MKSFLFNDIIYMEGDFVSKKKEEKKKPLKWYDSGHMITTLILVVIITIIVMSQSYANGELTFALLSSVINHNSIYLLIFVYFILLKFSFGKKYFNYLNVFLIFIYFITTVTSFLTVIQSFSLSTILNFILNFIFFIYLGHTLLRDTRFWKEFHLSESPFNELTNEGVYYAICVISLFLLAVNLISTAVISGVVISVLDTIYYLLFGRYIYLYREYLDTKKLDSDNPGNFDEVREKVQEVLDKTEIDDVVVAGIQEVKQEVHQFVEENHVDEKVEIAKEKITEVSNNVKEKVKESLPKESKSTKKTTKKKGE